MLSILVSRLPCLPSRLASRLPGVYLWHKGSTPLMLGACQHNHHELLHLCELSKNKRSRRNSFGAFSVNRHPRWSGFFPVVLLEHRHVQKLCQCSQNLSLTTSRHCEVCLRALTAFSFWEGLDDHRGDRMLECGAIRHAEINQHWSKNRYFWCYFGFFFFSLCMCVNNKKWVWLCGAGVITDICIPEHPMTPRSSAKRSRLALFIEQDITCLALYQVWGTYIGYIKGCFYESHLVFNCTACVL